MHRIPFRNYAQPRPKKVCDAYPTADGRGILQAARPTGTIDGFVGLLAGRTKKAATIEEINEAAAQASAAAKS